MDKPKFYKKSITLHSRGYMDNYESDPDRIKFYETLEASRLSRQRWLMVQIIGVFILIAVQIAFICFDVLPNEYMLWWPVLIIVWGSVFVTRSWLHGKKMLKYIDDYFERRR